MPHNIAMAAFEKHFPVSRETLERLERYEHLLIQWSPQLSLVGRSTLDQIWDRHFLDSAQLMPYVKATGYKFDIGTGAGFPGMVLAIMGIPDIHLVDNNQRKIEFLQTVAAETGTTVTIHNCKVEALPPLRAKIVMSRALGSLESLLTLGAAFFTANASGLFLKGRNASTEIEAARKSWDFELETFPSLTSGESSILRLARIRKKK